MAPDDGRGPDRGWPGANKEDDGADGAEWAAMMGAAMAGGEHTWRRGPWTRAAPPVHGDSGAGRRATDRGGEDALAAALCLEADGP